MRESQKAEHAVDEAAVPTAPHRPRRSWYIGAVAAVLILVGGLTAWQALRAASSRTELVVAPGTARDFNVLLVTLDTLRADHLGCYGYRRIETPSIDRLAAQGVRFAQAVTTVPMTLPSHATILTGLYPPRHGVRDNGTFRLLPEHDTLAEILERNGYATAAFIAAFVLDARYGLDQGFDHYDDDLTLEHRLATPQAPSNPDRPADVVVDAALKWIGQHRGTNGSQPFFAWVHLFDPHQPWAPPEPYRRRYADRPYDGEIAFLDAQVGRLVDGLTPLGVTERTLVVLIGDHGEGLGDHGEETHRQLIYESTLRVPLIFWGAGLFDGGTVVERQLAATVDLLPTVLSLLDIPVPTVCDGRNLFAGDDDPDRVVYVETLSPQLNDGWAPLFGARRLGEKYIDAPSPEYYDLIADPHELGNLIEKRPDPAGELADALEKFRASFPAASESASVTPTAQELARLAALGYVGGARAPDAEPSDLDPKVMILTFKERLRGIHLMNQGRAREAVALFEQLIERNPRGAELWSLLARACTMIGETDRALRCARRAVELRPDKPDRWCALARQYLALGQNTAAEACLSKALELDPSHGEVFLIRARDAFDNGRLEQALAQCRRAATQDAVRCTAEAKALTGLIHVQKDETAEAEAAFEAALEHDPRNGTALLNLAKLLAQRGDDLRAIGLLQQLVDGQPEFLEGGRLMGRLYFEVDQPDVAARVLRVVVQRNPSDAEAHYQLSRVLAAHGSLDESLRHLETAAGLGTIDFDALRSDPAFARLADHPRVALSAKLAEWQATTQPVSQRAATAP